MNSRGGDPRLAQPFLFLNRIPDIEVIFFNLALLLGVLSIFLPRLRAARLERRYQLQQRLPDKPALQEIREFLDRHAPDVQIKVNLLRSDHVAFIYPLTYHKAAVAILAPFVKLWRADRPAAEAVLLHEIGHYHHKDVLIVGAGSFFRTVVKSWVFVYLFLDFLPQFLEPIFDMETFDVKNHISFSVSNLIAGNLPWGISLLVTQPVWTLSLFIVPLVGIWCAELNADHFVIKTLNSSQTLLQALEQLPSQTSWWRWLLFRMSHPPDKLRRWMAQHWTERKRAAILLFLFPLAYLTTFLIQVFFLISNELYSSVTSQPLNDSFGAGLWLITESMLPLWAALAALLIVWRYIERLWLPLFRKTRGAFAARSLILVSLLTYYGTAVAPAVNQAIADTNRLSQHFHLGDQVQTDNGVIITITDTQADQGAQYTYPKPGNIYLVITLLLKNTLSPTSFISPLDFVVYDNSGKQYYQGYDPPHSDWSGNNVNPGASISVQMVFEISLSIQTYIFSYAPTDTGGTAQITWDITAPTTTLVPTPTPTLIPIPTWPPTPTIPPPIVPTWTFDPTPEPTPGAATPTPTPPSSMLASYTAPVPGPGCDLGGAFWTTEQAVTRCSSAGMILTSLSQQYLASVYFRSPGHTFPSRYSVSIDISGLSFGTCAGILTHGVPGQTYPTLEYRFFVCEDGSWEIDVFEDSGQVLVLARGAVQASHSYHLQATTDGSIQGIDVNHGPLQAVIDSHYPGTSTLGLSAYTYGPASGPASVIFSNFVYAAT